MASPPASSRTLEARIELPWVQKFSLSESESASATAPFPNATSSLALQPLRGEHSHTRVATPSEGSTREELTQQAARIRAIPALAACRSIGDQGGRRIRHERVDPVPQLRGERSDKGPSGGLVAIPDEGARARTVGDLGLAKRAPRGVDVLLGAQPQSLTRDAGPHADQLRSLALSAVGHPEYLHGVAAGVGIRA